MNRLVISIGSNTPDRRERMERAVEWLAETFHVTASSKIYETAEYHGRYAPYFNCVVRAESTESDTTAIISRLKAYERSQGRTEESKTTGQVPIDLDLVTFNDSILRPHELDREYFLIGYREINNRL